MTIATRKKTRVPKIEKGASTWRFLSMHNGKSAVTVMKRSDVDLERCKPIVSKSARKVSARIIL
jgi:hypothetical protein